MGSTPVAIGSSVPPWPAFSALSRRRTRAITWVDVIPGGLSMTSQPWMGTPLRLRATGASSTGRGATGRRFGRLQGSGLVAGLTAFVLFVLDVVLVIIIVEVVVLIVFFVFGTGLVVLVLIVVEVVFLFVFGFVVARPFAVHPGMGAVVGADMIFIVLVILIVAGILPAEVARDIGFVEQTVDVVGIFERSVGLERQRRDVAQLYLAGDLAAEEGRGAAHGRHRLFDVPAAERRDKGSRVAEVRTDPDFGHGDVEVLEFGIAEITPAQDIRQRVAQLLADTQLPLRWVAACAFVAHEIVSFFTDGIMGADRYRRGNSMNRQRA